MSFSSLLILVNKQYRPKVSVILYSRFRNTIRIILNIKLKISYQAPKLIFLNPPVFWDTLYIVACKHKLIDVIKSHLRLEKHNSKIIVF